MGSSNLPLADGCCKSHMLGVVIDENELLVSLFFNGVVGVVRTHDWCLIHICHIVTINPCHFCIIAMKYLLSFSVSLWFVFAT